MKDDSNCGRILMFCNMTEEGWKALVNKNRGDISDCVYKYMFENNENPQEEMIDFFSKYNFASCKVSKGDNPISGALSGKEEYVTDTESILDEVKIWSELAADHYLAKAGESEKATLTREYVGKIITRYVLEQVADVVEMAYDEMKFVPTILFKKLPSILNAQTKPTTGGLFGMIMALVADDDGKPLPEKPFEARLRDNPWETVAKLKKECVNAMQTAREYESTENRLLRSYLMSIPNAEQYSRLKSDAKAMQLISELESKIKSMEMFHPKLKEHELIQDQASFVARLVYNLDRLHEKMFDYQVDEVRKIIAETKVNDGSPIGLLKDITNFVAQRGKSHFYLDEILSGNSSVEKFDNPEIVKEWASENPNYYKEKEENYEKHTKEYAYTAVLCEMRGCGAYNDKVFNHLADMLVAQENKKGTKYTGVAFRYSRYVADGGNPDCLKGMEKEEVDVKAEFLDVLEYNGKYNIVDQKTYENKLKKSVLEAEDKMKVLEEAGEQLRQQKTAYEKMMIGE